MIGEQKPSVGRVVHYVSHGTPVGPDGTQAFSSVCRAAVISEVSTVPHLVDDVVGLTVLNPDGLFFHPLTKGGCRYDGDENSTGSYGGGTWHWPERV